jgi:hypothetical protein
VYDGHCGRATHDKGELLSRPDKEKRKWRRALLSAPNPPQQRRAPAATFAACALGPLARGGCERGTAAAWARLPGVGGAKGPLGSPVDACLKSCFAPHGRAPSFTHPLHTHFLYNATAAPSCPLSTGLTSCICPLSFSPPLIHSVTPDTTVPTRHQHRQSTLNC